MITGMIYRQQLRIPVALALIAAGASAADAATVYQRTFVPKHGGAVCYDRVYSNAFLKKNPALKIKAISITRRATLSNGSPSGSDKFELELQVATKSEAYTSIASCKTAGANMVCNLESDGGQFGLAKLKGAVRLFTRRIQIEGLFKELEIVAAKGKPSRTFTLSGHGSKSCASISG